MDDLLKYENREQLYVSLLKDLNLKKLEEKYYAKAMGNFYIILAAKEFLIRYVNDRNFLTIEFAINSEPGNWLDLGFLMNFVNKSREINPNDERDNFTRITELNNFLRNKYDIITNLLDKDNGKSTLHKLQVLLQQEFERKHPGSIKYN